MGNYSQDPQGRASVRRLLSALHERQQNRTAGTLSRYRGDLVMTACCVVGLKHLSIGHRVTKDRARGVSGDIVLLDTLCFECSTGLSLS